MGQVVEIQPQIRVRQTIPILDPQKDLRDIIDADMGSDIAKLYDKVVEGLMCEAYTEEGDNYENIADGYRGMLVDTMNELQEILAEKRLNRKRIQELYEQLYDNL